MKFLDMFKGVPVLAYKEDGTFIGEYETITKAMYKLIHKKIRGGNSLFGLTKKGERRIHYSKMLNCKFYLIKKEE